MPRQKLKKVYLRSGLIYLLKTHLLKKNTLIGKKSYPIITPKSRSFNIQELADNDLIVSKKISNYKTLELKQNKNKKVLKKSPKKVKKPLSKKLFNNPFDQLKNINVK